jgi:hypothetical protein
MSIHPPRQASLSEVASFPPGYFLENIAVRADGSILVTVVFHRELWWVPAPGSFEPGGPRLLHTFDDPAMGIVEVEPDVFCVSASSPGKGAVYRLDLRAWSPGEPVRLKLLADFAPSVGMLNGSCLVGPGAILLADCFAGLIWRLDLDGEKPAAAPRPWLAHESMAHRPQSRFPQQPGVNGLKFAAGSGWLYYTSTAQGLFMRVAVDRQTLQAVGEPQVVASGLMGDDFCLDEQAGVAYVTTHRENTIDRLSLTPGENEGPRRSVAGQPYTSLLTGPSSAAWGRRDGDLGAVAYVTTDGGVMSLSPDAVLQPAKVLSVALAPAD